MPEPGHATASNDGRLRIAAIADVHATPASKGQWRESFAEISHAADVLCLCGDLTNLGTQIEAESLAEDLRACAIPVMAVLGNHDYHSGQPDDVERVLRDAGVKFLEDEVHVVKAVGFAGVKGFCGGFDGRMLGAFGEPAIKAFVQEALDQALRLEHALLSHNRDPQRRSGVDLPVPRLLPPGRNHRPLRRSARGIPWPRPPRHLPGPYAQGHSGL
jgi:Icc-related predicted phosphoesterase